MRARIRLEGLSVSRRKGFCSAYAVGMGRELSQTSMRSKSSESCSVGVRLCDPMDYTVHGFWSMMRDLDEWKG